jgi:hypothetical protein
LRAVIELNPSALKQAALLDVERRLTGKRSELHGIPILLKVTGQDYLVRYMLSIAFRTISPQLQPKARQDPVLRKRE